MAVSNMGCGRKSYKRYKFFFYTAGFIVVMQLYMGYSFYSMNQSDLEEIRKAETRKRNIEINFNKTKITHQSEVIRETQDRISRRKKPQIKPKATFLSQNDASDNEGIRMKCKLKATEAESAVERATTNQCKQEIIDVVCQHQTDSMFAKTLPRYCPLKENNKGTYIGCYSDSKNKRMLTSVKEVFHLDNSPSKCVDFCLMAGTKYAGLQYSYECWCGNTLDSTRQLLEEKCTHTCPGKDGQKCGGFLTISTYHTGVGDRPKNPAPIVRALDAGEEPVKIVFVMTVNGRADRQVKRLFKALYHPHHYYYIHVDSRQEYLYRELLPLQESFPNVRLASQRFSSIWGGASLLTMLLRCMQDLLATTDWNWDYFLNLSESDYPIKPLSELVAYLTKNKGMNFLRAHGSNTPKFIRKQGLDKVFVECDTHMWRVGARPVPTDIVISGGSDWICLHRQFAQYVVSSNDELVTNLKTYYKYALLPAESFFHTVLVNSEHCNTHVDNNLHMTNWNRKQGCKCQYKHIVDWCGCSPNDFLPHDYSKLQSSRTHPTYFARKFEAIVSQDIISVAEGMAGHEGTKDQATMRSFWQNEYHHIDTSKTDDSFITYYHSFVRQGLVNVMKLPDSSDKCFQFKKLLQAHVFAHKDSIQGIVVQYEVESGAGDVVVMETLAQQHNHFKMHQLNGPAASLQKLHVGATWDPKEEIFRNYGGFLGPESSITLAIHWSETEGKDFVVTAVYIDPAQTIAASYELPVKGTDRVSVHKPVFKKPLRPGIWKVRLLYTWQLVAENTFVIIPLTHRNKVAISDTDAINLHSGPAGELYVEKDFKNFTHVLNIKESDVAVAKQQAEENSRLMGEKLRHWVDETTKHNYHIAESCVSNSNKKLPTGCINIPQCELTRWSSLIPDPKSDWSVLKSTTNS